MARNTLDYAVSKRLRQFYEKEDIGGSVRKRLRIGQRKFFENCLKEIEKLELEALEKVDLEQRLNGELYEGAELREHLRKFLGI